MTHEDIVYDRRIRLIEYAAACGNVTHACQVFGVSRKTYCQWLKAASAYGTSALLPKARRAPHQPNAMSPEEVSVILAEAVARPTLGPKSLLRHMAARGVNRSASGVAKALRRHHLGTARQRVAALASLTAADAGQVTDASLEGPFGFCLFATHPGQVVALDTFCVGRLKGAGAVWQLTAVDVATRTAVVQLVVGDKPCQDAACLDLGEGEGHDAAATPLRRVIAPIRPAAPTPQTWMSPSTRAASIRREVVPEGSGMACRVSACTHGEDDQQKI